MPFIAHFEVKKREPKIIHFIGEKEPKILKFSSCKKKAVKLVITSDLKLEIEN